MKEEINKACILAKELAIKAGEKILEVYSQDFKVEYKEDNSPLTIADKMSNDLICEGLKANFPEMAILAEESEDDYARLENDWCFLVDPLDGTKEFVKKNGEFTVNIALAYKGKPVMGVVYVPVTGKLYWASKDSGAYVQDIDGMPQKITASDKLESLTLAVSRSHVTSREKDLIEKYDVDSVIKCGSAIKGCLVAEGTVDIYYRYGGSMQWDSAAMQAVAEEAGCIFRQMDGSEMTYNRKGLVNDKGFFIVNRKENIFEDMLIGKEN